MTDPLVDHYFVIRTPFGYFLREAPAGIRYVQALQDATKFPSYYSAKGAATVNRIPDADVCSVVCRAVPIH